MGRASRKRGGAGRAAVWRVRAPAASTVKMRIGASLRGLTTVGPWVQPLSTPWEARGLGGPLCWGGCWGGQWPRRHRPAAHPTAWTVAGNSGAAQGRSRGPPLGPAAWTNVDGGDQAGWQRTLSPAVRGDSLAWIGPLIKTLMTPTAPRGADDQAEVPADPAVGK